MRRLQATPRLHVLLATLLLLDLACAFVLPPSLSSSSSSPLSSSTRSTRRAASPTSNGVEEEKDDSLASWTLGTVPDVTLLEAARKEALEKDAEWYQSIIGGSIAPAPAAAAVAGPPGIEDGATVNPLALRPLIELGYSRQEAAQLPEDIAGIIVEDQISRPLGALPREWLAVDMGAKAAVAVAEDMESKSTQNSGSSARRRDEKILQQRSSRSAPPPSRPLTPSSKRAQRKRDAAQYKKVYEQEALMDEDVGWEEEEEDEEE